MRPVRVVVGVLTNDPNGIFEDQTAGGAGNLSLDGALVSNGVASAAYAQKVSLESSGNLSAVTFTITGTDADGQRITESLAGPNNNTVHSTHHFKTVSNVAVDGTVGTNVEGGFLASQGMVTPTIPLDYRQGNPAGLYFQLRAGTMTVASQYTPDDPCADRCYEESIQKDGLWLNAKSGVSASGAADLTAPAMAVRFIQTAGSATGECVFTVVQGMEG